MYGLRRRTRARRAGAGPPPRIRGRAAGADRQRRLQAAPARRLGRAARAPCYLHTRSRDSLDERVWPILKRQVEAAIEHWRKPDCGIWEVRGGPKHFTSSKMFCWLACDRGARLAAIRGDSQYETRWREAADGDPRRHLRERHGRARCVRPALRNRCAGRLVLLMPLLQFLPPDDERMRRDRVRHRR